MKVGRYPLSPRVKMLNEPIMLVVAGGNSIGIER